MLVGALGYSFMRSLHSGVCVSTYRKCVLDMASEALHLAQKNCSMATRRPLFRGGLASAAVELGGTNLTYRVVGAPKNGQKVSLLALVANSETRKKI